MNTKKGFTLLIAIVTTSILLLISFVIIDIAVKQLLIVYSGQESQHAFYAADSGVECAIYWDTHYSVQSAFATATPGSVNCNNQTVSTGSEVVPTIPSQQSVVGGGGSNPTSIFSITFAKGCAIVQVTKLPNGNTQVDSHGYNTCNTSADRRYERGVTITY